MKGTKSSYMFKGWQPDFKELRATRGSAGWTRERLKSELEKSPTNSRWLNYNIVASRDGPEDED